MSPEEFQHYLAHRIQELGSPGRACEAWGVSPMYVRDLLAGNRRPGKKILAALGIEAVKTVDYILSAKE